MQKKSKTQAEILQAIKSHTKENPILSDTLEAEFNVKGDEIRRAIRCLRRQGEPICIVTNNGKNPNPKGYYYCLKDALKTINNLESRSFSMLKTAKAMREKCGLLNEATLI